MKLVDMLFSEGSGSSRTGSTPVTRTTNKYIKKITVITVSCGFIFYDRKNYYVNFWKIIR